MNILTPVILIIISIGTFFVYINPNYRGQNQGAGAESVMQLQKEYADYQNALNNAKEIATKRDSLQTKSNEFKLADTQKLEKLLPDNIDNIKLVIDMNNIANKHGLELKGAKLDTNVNIDPNKIGADTSKYGTVGISFTVVASYENFQAFLADLEKSLRLVEVTDLSITGSNTGLYNFSVSLKTYWLK